MNRTRAVWIALGVALAVVAFGSIRTLAQDADDHDAEATTHDDHDDEGDVHDDHDDSSDAGQVDLVEMTSAEMAEFGVSLATARPGALAESTSLPGEITLDGDRLAHVTARVSGTVREVVAHLGDTVSAGEPLAVLDSVAMGDAIVAYLNRHLEVQAASAAIDVAKAGVDVAELEEATRKAAVDVAREELTVVGQSLSVTEEAASAARAVLSRQGEVTSNTTVLLDALAENVTGEKLDTLIAGKDAGSNRGALLVAHADLVAADVELERELLLHEEGISSASEVVVARQAARNAQATFDTARDEASYGVGSALRAAEQELRSAEQDARAARQASRVASHAIRTDEQAFHMAEQAVREAGQVVRVAELSLLTAQANATGAERALHVLGLSDEEITHLSDRAQDHANLTRFVLRAPFDGTVVRKHIAVGEYVEPGADLYQVADMRSVWVNLTVYQKDLPFVSVGRHARISVGHMVESAHGVVSYVSPTVDEATRTALARVVLDNEAGIWRPGLFVTGSVAVSDEAVGLLIPRAALQTFEDRLSVFVLTDEGFEPHPVATGRANDTHVEVVSGLEAGDRYAATGAFTLKAQLAKASFGDGHNH
jgi:membrane fusion protein, heavy metal efflux system